MRGTRNRKGQAFIETAVAATFLVPMVIVLLDLSVMVLCNMTNDAAAKNAARAAANQPTQALAMQAAQNSLLSFKKSPIINNVIINGFDYTKSHDAVTVSTKMQISIPVAIPGIGQQTFIAQSVQPIVAE